MSHAATWKLLENNALSMVPVRLLKLSWQINVNLNQMDIVTDVQKILLGLARVKRLETTGGILLAATQKMKRKLLSFTMTRPSISVFPYLNK